ncbi:SRT-24 protein, partial [Aphelenchoides avenae]
MNPIHAVHNTLVLCGLSITYAIFVIMIVVKTSYFGGQERRSSFQRMTFIQVALISAVNATAASVYVCMNYFYVSPALIIIGQFAWCSAH